MQKKSVDFLSVAINTFSIQEIQAKIEGDVKSRTKSLFFALNIHNLVLLHKDSEFRKIFKQATVNFMDGVPLLFLISLLKKVKIERVSGTDLTEVVLSNTRNKIFAIVSDKSIGKLVEKKYKSIVGWVVPPLGDQWPTTITKKINKQINKSGAKIILIGISPPKQEKWLYTNLKQTSAYVGIGCGSAMEILVGEKKRAPKVLQNFGLEWLWRLVLEPKRLVKRYVHDAFFFIKILLESVFLKR